MFHSTDCRHIWLNRRRVKKWKKRPTRSIYLPENPFFLHFNQQPLVTCDQLRARTIHRELSLFDLTYGTNTSPSCAPNGWNAFFFHYDVKKAVKSISDALVQEIEFGYHVNPRIGSIFKALVSVPVKHVKVVIIGESPTSHKGLASGLAFSLEPSFPASVVPSIQRLLLEARNEQFCVNSENADLSYWAEQGALLLNSALSTRSGNVSSHAEIWRPFTKELIKFINSFAKPSAWILFGEITHSLADLIDVKKHYIIKAGDPSPSASSRKFFCGNYFNCANKWLSGEGRGVIDWNLLRRSPACLGNPHRSFAYTVLEDRVDKSRVTVETECEMRSCTR